MPNAYTGNPSTYYPTVDFIADGDDAEEANSDPIERILDNTAYLKATEISDVTNLQAQITAITSSLRVKNWPFVGAGVSSMNSATQSCSAACRNPGAHSWIVAVGHTTSAVCLESTDGGAAFASKSMPTTGITGDVVDASADANGNIQIVFASAAGTGFTSIMWNGSSWVAGVSAFTPWTGSGPSVTDGANWRTVSFDGKFVSMGTITTLTTPGNYVDPAAPTSLVAMPNPAGAPAGYQFNAGFLIGGNGVLLWLPMIGSTWAYVLRMTDPTNASTWTYPAFPITGSEGVASADYSTSDAIWMAAISTAGGSSSRFVTSPDGTTWTTVAGTIAAQVQNLAAMSSSLWLAETTTGIMYYSTNKGVSWTLVDVSFGYPVLTLSGARKLLRTSGGEQLLSVSNSQTTNILARGSMRIS